jgi:hypothetical protein
MTSNMPLTLSDSQLERLMQAAAMLPVQARDNFLRSVANRVADLPRIGTAEIEDAIAFVLAGRGIIAGRRDKTHQTE